MILLLLSLVVPLGAQAPPKEELVWTDIRQMGVEGKGWKDTGHPFDRLPARAELLVRPPVWSLSHDSAGMSVRFSSDASTLAVRWTVRNQRLELPHMPATGVSGVDLYVRHNGKWRWLANGRPEARFNERTMVQNWKGGRREYLLYLPLYNGVEAVHVGVTKGTRIEPGAARPASMKPMVFYGTSILQGGCASRPGMAYPSIVSRMLDWPQINLGFSGNALSEPEMAVLLSEIDASVFVYDSLPNLREGMVQERTGPFLRQLRNAHPKMPIVLVENVIYTDADFVESRRRSAAEKNAALRAVYEGLVKEGMKDFYYVPATKLLGEDGEGTVDGTHPNDLGFLRMAEVIGPVLRPLLVR